MEIETLIGNYAFPVAVTAYLLWERSRVINNLRSAIENNTLVTQELVNQLRKN